MKMVKLDEEKEESNKKKKQGSVKEVEWQMWHLNGTRCPMNTVPIRRSTVPDVLRAKFLYDFGRKPPQSLPLARQIDPPDVISGNGHEVINFRSILLSLVYFNSEFQTNNSA